MVFPNGELIETLWNVNRVSAILLKAVERINRNIVECKLERILLCGFTIQGINRNIVECKLEKIVNESSGGLMN